MIFKRFEGTKIYKIFASVEGTEKVETSLAIILPSTLKNLSARLSYFLRIYLAIASAPKPKSYRPEYI